jgi:hypothetical protein
MRKPKNSNPAQDPSSEPAPFSTSTIQKSLEVIGKVVAPSAVLVALLFYFGWVRTNALYSAFGIDQSLLQFTTQDYLLRSIQVALGSVSTFLMAALALIWGHYGLRRLKNINQPWFIRITSLICIASFSLVVISYLLPQDKAVSILTPLLWTIGVAFLVYGLATLSQTKWLHGASFLHTLPEWLRSWSVGIIIALLIVGAFSTTSIFARMQGQAQAETIKKNPGILAAVTVYSRMPLMLEGTGISVDMISEDADTFRYRYQGLRFFVRSGGNYFLLPSIWKNKESHAIILSESDKIRVEVSY